MSPVHVDPEDQINPTKVSEVRGMYEALQVLDRKRGVQALLAWVRSERYAGQEEAHKPAYYAGFEQAVSLISTNTDPLFAELAEHFKALHELSTAELAPRKRARERNRDALKNHTIAAMVAAGQLRQSIESRKQTPDAQDSIQTPTPQQSQADQATPEASTEQH